LFSFTSEATVFATICAVARAPPAAAVSVAVPGPTAVTIPASSAVSTLALLVCRRRARGRDPFSPRMESRRNAFAARRRFSRLRQHSSRAAAGTVRSSIESMTGRARGQRGDDHRHLPVVLRRQIQWNRSSPPLPAAGREDDDRVGHGFAAEGAQGLIESPATMFRVRGVISIRRSATVDAGAGCGCCITSNAETSASMPCVYSLIEII
jgi:hypothetical protein